MMFRAALSAVFLVHCCIAPSLVHGQDLTALACAGSEDDLRVFADQAGLEVEVEARQVPVVLDAIAAAAAGGNLSWDILWGCSLSGFREFPFAEHLQPLPEGWGASLPPVLIDESRLWYAPAANVGAICVNQPLVETNN